MAAPLAPAAEEGEGFKRWLLLRFGHAEAAFAALESTARRSRRLEEGNALDLVTLEEAARSYGFQGPPGAARSLFSSFVGTDSSTVDASTFLAAFTRHSSQGANLPIVPLGPSASADGISALSALSHSFMSSNGSVHGEPEPGGVPSVVQLRAQCSAVAAQIKRDEDICRRAAAARVGMDAMTDRIRAESSTATARLQAGQDAYARMSADLDKHQEVVALRGVPSSGDVSSMLRQEVEMQRRQADLMVGVAESERADCEKLGLRLQNIRKVEQRAESDLMDVRREFSEMTERITREQAAAARLKSASSETLQNCEQSVAELEIESREAQTSLAGLESEAAALVSEALDLLSGSAVSKSVAVAPMGNVSGLVGLCDAHRSIARLWTRRLETEAALGEEARAAEAALEKLEQQHEGLLASEDGEKRLRLELEEAREASAAVWGLAAGVVGEASENDELRMQHVGIQEEQETAVALLARQAQEMQSELTVATGDARRADAEIGRQIANLRAQLVRAHVSYRSAENELEMQQRSDQFSIEKLYAQEAAAQANMQLERKRSMQELVCLQEQAEALAKKHGELARELAYERTQNEEEDEADAGAFRNLQEELMQQQEGTLTRMRELSLGLAQLEEAHRSSEAEARADRERWRSEAQQHGNSHRFLRAEFSSILSAVGGRSPRQVSQWLAHEEESHARAFDMESRQAERAAALLAEVQSTRHLGAQHRMALRNHAASVAQSFALEEQNLSGRLRHVWGEVDRAEQAVHASRKEALRIQMDASHSIREEVGEAGRRERYANTAMLSDLQAELDDRCAQERQAVADASSDVETHRAAVDKAASWCQVMADTFEIKFVQGASSLADSAIGDPLDVPLGAQQLAAALREYAVGKIRETSSHLGRLLRKKIALTSEAAELEAERADELAMQIRDAEFQHDTIEQQMVSEMHGAAGRVERLRATLHEELGALRSNGADGTERKDRFYSERVRLFDEVHDLRESTLACESRIQAMLEANTRTMFEEDKFREAMKEVESRIRHENIALQRLEQQHSEECELSQRLTDTVTAHSEILDPARNSEVEALMTEGRYAEARLRTEIATERRAALHLHQRIESILEDTASAEAGADRIEREISLTDADAAEMAASMERAQATHEKRIEDAKEQQRTAVEDANEKEAKLKNALERQRQELQHLEQLGFRLEREVERRIGQRSANCRGELADIENRAAEQKVAEASAVQKANGECALVADTLADLKEEKTRAAWELASARVEWQRWWDSAGRPAHVRSSEQLQRSIEMARAQGAEEMDSLRREIDDRIADAVETATQSVVRKLFESEEAALRKTGDAVTAAICSCAEAAAQAKTAAGRAADLIGVARSTNAAITQEEAACVALDYQVRALRFSSEEIERRSAEKAQKHRLLASTELEDLYQTLANLRAEAKLRVQDHATRETCDICGAAVEAMVDEYTDNQPDVKGKAAPPRAKVCPVCGERSPNEADAALLKRLSAFSIGQARWRTAAGVARESVREAMSPTRVAQLKTDRAEVAELRACLDELRKEGAKAEASTAAAMTELVAKNKEYESLLAIARQKADSAASTVAVLHEQNGSAVEQYSERVSHILAKENELAEELATTENTIEHVASELEQKTRATELELATSQQEREEAMQRAQHVEVALMMNLQVIAEDLAAWAPTSARSPHLLARQTVQCTPVDPHSLVDVVSKQCDHLNVAWRAALQGLKVDSQTRAAAIEAIDTETYRHVEIRSAELLAVHAKLEALSRDGPTRLQQLTEEYARQISEALDQQLLAEEPLREELRTARASFEQSQRSFEKQRASWHHALVAAATQASTARDERLEEWAAERQVLEGVLLSWQQGAASARAHFVDAEEREAELRRNTSEVVARLSENGAALRQEMRLELESCDQRLQLKAQELQNRFDVVREEYAERQAAASMFAREEWQAHELHEHRRAGLATELATMKSAFAGLQRKHRNALQAIKEMEHCFPMPPANTARSSTGSSCCPGSVTMADAPSHDGAGESDGVARTYRQSTANSGE